MFLNTSLLSTGLQNTWGLWCRRATKFSIRKTISQY